ncbi:MAG: 4-alpha-glucanotransferase, partial [Mycobacterium sp.]
MTPVINPSLAELAHRLGVATEYYDWVGHLKTVEPTTVVAVLSALGFKADTEIDCAASISEHTRKHWARNLPPVIVARTGSEAALWVHVTHGAPAEVWVRLEDGSIRTNIRQADNFTAPFDLDGRRVGEATFVLPGDLPLGYHRVHLRSGDTECVTPLIVTPDWLGMPARMGARRTWGLATQLYSLTSKGSWGVGDLTDLADLAVWAGSRHGAGFVLINPLHAAAPTAPMEPSPYLPTSRRFVSPLYLRVEAIPEFATMPGRRRVRKSQQACAAAARKGDIIDRDAAWAAKRAALA